MSDVQSGALGGKKTFPVPFALWRTTSPNIYRAAGKFTF
jgi:hypothetical protein